MASMQSCDVARLPSADTGFSDIRNSGRIYIDKTALLADFAVFSQPFLFSRPGHFGKTLLVDTLECLFSRGTEAFHGLAVEGLWKDTTYHVVRLDLSVVADATPDELEKQLSETLIERFGVAGQVDLLDPLGNYWDPGTVLSSIKHRMDNRSVVLLIDNYDAPYTHHMDRPEELEKILSTMYSFYAVVKSCSSMFRFILLTGVTRIIHASIFSGFNTIRDISLDEQYAALLGFTQDEIRQHLDGYVENAAAVLGMTKEGVYADLEQYYGGYIFSPDATESVYNPSSVLSFLKDPEKGFRNYWHEPYGFTPVVEEHLRVSEDHDFMKYADRELPAYYGEIDDLYEFTSLPHRLMLLQSGYFALQTQPDGINRILPPNEEVELSLLRHYLRANGIEISCQTRELTDHLDQLIDRKDLPALVGTFNAILKDCETCSPAVFRTMLRDERYIRDILSAVLSLCTTVQVRRDRDSAVDSSDLELITERTHMVTVFRGTHLKDESDKSDKTDRSGEKSRSAEKKRKYRKRASTKATSRSPEDALAEAAAHITARYAEETVYQRRSLLRVALVISEEEKRILPEYCREVQQGV